MYARGLARRLAQSRAPIRDGPYVSGPGLSAAGLGLGLLNAEGEVCLYVGVGQRETDRQTDRVPPRNVYTEHRVSPGVPGSPLSLTAGQRMHLLPLGTDTMQCAHSVTGGGGEAALRVPSVSQ